MKRSNFVGSLIAAPVAGSTLLAARLDTPNWIQRSDSNSERLGTVLRRFRPEDYGDIEHANAAVLDPSEAADRRFEAELAGVAEVLRARQKYESDPNVATDLSVLVAAAERIAQEVRVQDRLELPYRDPAKTVFAGLANLLDGDATSRLHAALAVRQLVRYAGGEAGFRPLTEAMTMRLASAEAEGAARYYPTRATLASDGESTAALIQGVRELLTSARAHDFEPTLTRLSAQLEAFTRFIASTLLSRARTAFRTNDAIYAAQLRANGIALAPDDLIVLARRGYDSLREHANAAAAAIAPTLNMTHDAGLASVIGALKIKHRIPAEALIATYRRRAQHMSDVIRREHIVTIPLQPLKIRAATRAEAATVPAPFFDPPHVLAKGVTGTFVLSSGGEGSSAKFDDFSYEPATWFLTAHEGRPGHEVQFAAMARLGISKACAVYAFNSANIEGWGMYAERLMQPYMPPAAQLVAMQMRMARAAYAFLEPSLQLGHISIDEAHRTLREEVGMSEGYTASLVRRFTTIAPGQAPSYYYGYTRLIALRDEVRALLHRRFVPLEFHNTVLAQGLLPFDLLCSAVLQKMAAVPGYQ